MVYRAIVIEKSTSRYVKKEDASNINVYKNNEKFHKVKV